MVLPDLVTRVLSVIVTVVAVVLAIVAIVLAVVAVVLAVVSIVRAVVGTVILPVLPPALRGAAIPWLGRVDDPVLGRVRLP